MFKAVKFRLYPTNEQSELLDRQFGCARFVWNWALDYSQWQFKGNRTKTNRREWQAAVPSLKQYLPWLSEGNSQSLQAELMHLERAYIKFFEKSARFPKFKTKYGKQSVLIPQNFRLTGDSLSIPKIKGIKCIVSIGIKGSIRSVTISKNPTGKYFASVLYDTGGDVLSPPGPTKDRSLGIDLGLKHFAILSDGDKIDNPRFLERGRNRLRLLHKSMSRKKKGSANRAKAKAAIALYHEKLSNQRSDFLHKLTHRLTVKNHAVDTICLENLNVKGMIRNRSLAKSISSVAWGEFVRQLKYKSQWYGKNLLQCDRFAPTSKTCNECGAKNDDLKLSARTWTCSCGAVLDRDVNAARNIIDFAYPQDSGDIKPVEMKALALGETKVKLLSVKREPSVRLIGCQITRIVT